MNKRKAVGVRWNVPMVNRRVSLHSNSLNHLRQAVVERVFTVKGANGDLVPPPRPTASLFNARLEFVERQLSRAIRVLRPMTRGQFLDTYSGRRRELYRRAADEFEKRGVRPSDAFVDGFLKIEPILKQQAVPRIIQPRKPRMPVYGYALGRFIKPYEHALKDALRKVAGYHVILKGFNSRRRAEILRSYWDLWTDVVVIGMDASRFDQHVSRVALEWEHRMWLRFCPPHLRKELKGLLDMQLRNRCTARCPEGVVKYTTDGCRMSGDMNTSAGNCMLMSSMLLAYVGSKGVEARVVNDGDDSLVFLRKRDLDVFRSGLESWFVDMGFTMALEPVVDRFERIEFCQCNPVFTAGGWIMVRKPTNSMGKDLTTTRKFANRQAELIWLQSVRDGGRCLADGVPVLGAFYEMFDTGVKVRVVPEAVADSGFYRMARGLQYRGLPITPEARASFWQAFGILPDHQVILENHFRQYRLMHFPHGGDIRPYSMPTIPSIIPPRI